MGRYVENNLVKDEQVVYQTTLHWVLFFKAKALLTLFLSPIIERATSEFVITNKRVIIKVGWLNVNTYDMNLAKIESVQVQQSLLARILGYGSMVLTGTGGSKEVFNNISRPAEFKREFQRHSL